MNLEPLTAISSVDGRYRKQLEDISLYLSELSLYKYRLKVEILYLIELANLKIIRPIKPKEKDLLNSLWQNFTVKEAHEIKAIESKIKHDVKAIEYFIKDKINNTSLKDIKEYVHFALTSEDINNIAYSLMINDAFKKVYFPQLNLLINEVISLAKKYKNIAMLSHTHGQPASPTTMGKEFAVFSYRLKNQLKLFPPLTGKINGAVGNYNAHFIAYPKINWLNFSKSFVSGLGLKPSLITTQIENHDTWVQTFQTMIRINNILIGFNRDIWTYISLDYLKQKLVAKEVGSSTMPHKINPIDFENSEGNLGVANSLLNHLSNKLPISRLQRDLSDSTASRVIGLIFGHTILAFKSNLKGLKKIEINQQKLAQDLNNHPEIIAEAIQIILRREGVKMPYEQLKKLTRGKQITIIDLSKFIDSLNISVKIKKELNKIRPDNYLGLAERITGLII